MKIEELFKEFYGKTNIQQNEHLKKLIGVEVLVSGQINNIDAEHIRLNEVHGNLELEVHGETRTVLPLGPELPFGILIFISHKNSQLGNQ